MQAWFTGIASKVDPKKIRFDDWMEQFQDPEDVKKNRKEKFDKGKDLWQDFQRNSDRQVLK